MESLFNFTFTHKQTHKPTKQTYRHTNTQTHTHIHSNNMESNSSAEDEKMTFEKRMKALEDAERTIKEKIGTMHYNIYRRNLNLTNLTESEMSVVNSLLYEQIQLLDVTMIKKERLARLEKA